MIVVVVAIIALVYFYIEGGSAPSNDNLAAEGGSIGQSELALLNQVSTLNIDTTFFSEPSYQSLRDFTVTIAPEPVGRPNPFAPVPGVGNPQSAPPAATNR